MNNTPAELAKILAAIQSVSAATNTEITMASNEKIRDGSRVLLASKEGWFIDATGARLFEGWVPPPIGLKLRGYIYNPKTELLEALTLHSIGSLNTLLDVPLEGPDSDSHWLSEILDNLVPDVREAAKRIHETWAAETARKTRIEQLKAHFDIEGFAKNFRHGRHTLELSVGSTTSDWASVGLSLKTDGLSPAQVEAILKVLDDPALSV